MSTSKQEAEAIADWLMRLVESVRYGMTDMVPSDAFLEMAGRGANAVEDIMERYTKAPAERAEDHTLVRLMAQQTLCQCELVAAAGQIVKALEDLPEIARGIRDAAAH